MAVKTTEKGQKVAEELLLHNPKSARVKAEKEAAKKTSK